MPMAYSAHVRSFYSVRNTSKDTVVVSGCDLVQPISVTGSGAYHLFTVIPANPAYWTGTRIGVLASAYFNYRPLRMAFHYVP